MSEVSVTAYPNGPYLVRGPFELLDEDGRPIELRRRAVALCRCGRSRALPFCDGTHKRIGFSTEAGEPQPAVSLPQHLRMVRPGADD